MPPPVTQSCMSGCPPHSMSMRTPSLFLVTVPVTWEIIGAFFPILQVPYLTTCFLLRFAMLHLLGGCLEPKWEWIISRRRPKKQKPLGPGGPNGSAIKKLPPSDLFYLAAPISFSIGRACRAGLA